MKKYNLTIIGAGPGGYVAALYASQRGMSVCLIEKDQVGGVCLNWGCIPTKTLVASAKALSAARSAAAFGVKTGQIELDFSVARKRMWDIAAKLRAGVEYLLKARKVDVIKGAGVILDAHTVQAGPVSVSTDNILIASGSVNIDISAAPVDEKSVLSSTGLLNLDTVPQELLIIGGGVIGCEFASLFHQFGSRVTIIEMMDRLMPASDDEIAKRLEALFRKNGISVKTGSKVIGTSSGNNGKINVALSDGETISADKVLVSVGRKPVVEGLGLEKTGVIFDRQGIKTDEGMRTSVPNIYAIGDCTGGAMLAHVASFQAIMACDIMAGEKRSMMSVPIPSAIFTDPEIASAGLTESAARKSGRNVKTAKFPFRALGKAFAEGKTEGFVKVVFDPDTKKILGADIMGEDASDLIAEMTLAIGKGLTVGDIGHTIHVHPSLAEAVMEACHGACGTPIHAL